jgi:hypothetical protein
MGLPPASVTAGYLRLGCCIPALGTGLERCQGVTGTASDEFALLLSQGGVDVQLESVRVGHGEACLHPKPRQALAPHPTGSSLRSDNQQLRPQPPRQTERGECLDTFAFEKTVYATTTLKNAEAVSDPWASTSRY